jgi:site-specific DNA-methyltransferase (adenine-specific)
VGDPLDGAAEPTLSAPQTPIRGGKKRLPKLRAATHEESNGIVDRQVILFRNGLLEAYRKIYQGYSLDRVIADPEINARLVEACGELGLPGEARTWNQALFGLRKAGALAVMPTSQRTEFSWEECDAYLFASEIAWRQMTDRGCDSLDTILCDPALAGEFDQIAGRWAPGYTPLQYRWAALKLRKNACVVRSRSRILTDVRLCAPITLKGNRIGNLPNLSGVYMIWSDQDPLYAGEAASLRERVERQVSTQTRDLWEADTLTARFVATDCDQGMRRAYQWRLKVQHHPRWNFIEKATRTAATIT